MAPCVIDLDSGCQVTIDMPPSRERTDLVAALRSGRYGEPPRSTSPVTDATIAELWEAAGRPDQAAVVRAAAAAKADVGAITRAARASRADAGWALTTADLAELFTAVGRPESARLVRQAHALRLAEPGEPTGDISQLTGERHHTDRDYPPRPLTPAEVATLCVGLPDMRRASRRNRPASVTQWRPCTHRMDSMFDLAAIGGQA